MAAKEAKTAKEVPTSAVVPAFIRQLRFLRAPTSPDRLPDLRRSPAGPLQRSPGAPGGLEPIQGRRQIGGGSMPTESRVQARQGQRPLSAERIENRLRDVITHAVAKNTARAGLRVLPEGQCRQQVRRPDDPRAV